MDHASPAPELHDYRVGERVEVEFTSGKKYRLPIVEILGDRIWLDDGVTRIQINMRTNQVLVLYDRSNP